MGCWGYTCNAPLHSQFSSDNECVCFVWMCMWNASFHIADQSIVVTALYCWTQMVRVWAVGYRKCCVCVLFSVVNSLSAVLTVLCVIMALSLIVNAPPLCSVRLTDTHKHTCDLDSQIINFHVESATQL